MVVLIHVKFYIWSVPVCGGIGLSINLHQRLVVEVSAVREAKVVPVPVKKMSFHCTIVYIPVIDQPVGFFVEKLLALFVSLWKIPLFYSQRSKVHLLVVPVSGQHCRSISVSVSELWSVVLRWLE